MSLDTLGNFSSKILWGPHPAIKNCKNYKYVLHATLILVIASTYLYIYLAVFGSILYKATLFLISAVFKFRKVY